MKYRKGYKEVIISTLDLAPFNMNTGVYLQSKSTSEVYDSIIINRYSKIFGLKSVTPLLQNTENMDSLGPSSEYTNSSEEEKWECGMNVRARFADDGEYYEATIEKIFDEYAVLRYLGYDNEEAVKLKDLRPSLGEESINEQLEKAADEKSADYTEDSYDDEDDIDIEWKVGMSCRALYEPNEVVYEAVIQEVSEKDRKAVVIMSGYGISYEVSFDDMYESIQELRIKQECSAKIHIASKSKAQQNEGVSPVVPNPFSFEKSNIDKPNKTEEAFQPVPPGAKPPLKNDQVPEPNSSIPTCTFANCQGMMQPPSENDALACLISSNYLSGYYAGYYDCLRKFQNSNQ